MITDMVWADVNNDGNPDMVIVGDWMPVKVFINYHGMFKDESAKYGLTDTEGWWNLLWQKILTVTETWILYLEIMV